MLKEGFILDERYKIINVAGKGGTSVVYRAADLRANNAQRAVKEVMKANGIDARNARQESQLIKEFYEKDVKNSFFPNIIDTVDTNDALYIVQDYIDGQSMEKILENSTLDAAAVLSYAKDICYVMSFIHKLGMIHSDMKPDNVMIVRNDENFENKKHADKFGKLKFIDFGSVIARREGTFAYTPAYAAPEQFMEKELDERTDIFNMGATYYHMLTGKKPMNVAVNGRFVPSRERFLFDKSMNADLVRIIQKCVNDDRSKRYRSCDELYDDLYKAENHTYVKITAILAVISAVFLIFSLTAGIIAKKTKSEDFNKLVEKAENASQYDEKSEALAEVIDADGSYSKAYLELIELYKKDMVFSEDETAQILRLINENINALRSDSQYEEVAYELGILYWYYYYYGNDGTEQNASTTGKIASVKWFSEAQTDNFKSQDIDKYQIAHIYCTIGDFYSQTQKKENELLKKSYSADLWASMNELNTLVVDANAGSDIIILETYKTLINLENTNMQDFARSGISFSEQKKLMDEIREKTEKINAAEGSAAELKEYILTSYDKVVESISGSQ